MAWPETLWYLVLVAGSIAAAVAGLHLGWRLHGQWKIHRAGPRKLLATRHRIWRPPPPDAAADLRFGPGGPDGAPAPPFQFVQEHLTGSQPCVAVHDARGRRWRVKWGHEAKPESFAVRLAWACGYFAEVTHYVPSGVIENAVGLSRSRQALHENGRFSDARFELEDPDVRMLFGEHSWSWDDNPFIGTPQFSGLKIVVMLLSNWDTKDRRDVSRGSSVLPVRGPAHGTRASSGAGRVRRKRRRSHAFRPRPARPHSAAGRGVRTHGIIPAPASVAGDPRPRLSHTSHFALSMTHRAV